MGKTTRSTALIAVLGVALLALAGCSPLTDSGAQSSQTSSTTAESPAAQPPTATNSPAPDAAASIVLSVTSLRIVDSSGTIISEHDYFAPVADVVAALTDALGSEPTISHFDAHGDGPAGTAYDWDGFVLRDGEWPTEAPYYSEFSVLLTAATVGGLTFSTSNGVTVGDSFVDVAAAHPDHVQSYPGGPLEFEQTELPPFPEGYGVEIVPAVSVMVIESEHSGVVSRILAPAMNWGA